MKSRAGGLISLLLLTLGFTNVFVNSSFASPPPTFTITGAGYGHGIGMSQIGARAQALQGASVEEILQYYYTGTSVSSFEDTAKIRVNIAHQATSLSLALDSNFDPSSRPIVQLIRGNLPPGIPISDLHPDLIGNYSGDITINFGLSEGLAVPMPTSPTAKFAAIPGDTFFTIRWSGTSELDGDDGLLNVTNSSNPKTKPKKIALRYGQVQVRVVADAQGNPKMEVTATMSLHDEYLFGIAEVPSSWVFAALQAQVIASRTFGLSRIQRFKPDCDCNVYNTGVDQAYVGYAKEADPQYGYRWRAAVMSTIIDSENAYAIVYKGVPINSYFFSSSGGATENIKDVWGVDSPYLVSVADPWSIDPKFNKSHASWTRTVSQSLMAKAFKLEDVANYKVVARNVSGSASRITATSSSGAKSTITGAQFAARLGLPAAWITSGEN